MNDARKDMRETSELHLLQESAAFKAGRRAGLREYAWWKDGTEYVGSCGTTLKKALADADREPAPKWLMDMDR